MTSSQPETSKVLEVATATSQSPLVFSLSKIHNAEARLPELRSMNVAVAADLKSQFLEAHAEVLKYQSTISFHRLKAKRQYDIAKADALLDKFPEYADNLRKSGSKDNADIREAFVCRDPDVFKWKETLDALEAVYIFMENKEKVLDRAYWECKSRIEDHFKITGNRSFNQGDDVLPIGVGNYGRS